MPIDNLRNVYNPFEMQNNDPFGQQVQSGLKGSFGPSVDLQEVANDPLYGDVILDNERSKRMQQLYSPEHRFEDLYSNQMQSMPQRKEPSILRRIAAIFAGNPEEQEHFKYAGYERQMQDWNTKLKSLEPGLNAERYSNANERQIASSTLQNEAANRRIDVQEAEAQRRTKEGEEKLRQGNEKLKIAQQRANTYDYRTKNPNNIIKEDAQGNMIGVNPQTNEVEYLLDDDGDPVKSINLTPEQRHNYRMQEIKAQGANSIAAAKVRGTESRTSENVKSANDLKEIEARGNQARNTKSTPAAKAVDAEGNVQTTTSSVTVKDAKGNPLGTRSTTTQKSTQKGGNTGVKMRTPDGKRIVLVPKDKVQEATAKGGKVVP